MLLPQQCCSRCQLQATQKIITATAGTLYSAEVKIAGKAGQLNARYKITEASKGNINRIHMTAEL
ncbi:DUF1471 domain-containing protein [Rosenbergiella nectarea]|uniref:DUF1471 domain-containing protein n=1 Tax=Rosenbergiella nectarea TaxID=988801 RepID=UPI001F4D41A0|nr:DUF1471 domain-containing protein [Rosenbergiella nectarea]